MIVTISSISLASLLTVFLTMTGASFGQSTRESDVRELEHLETAWNEAHEHGDSNALEALWADDLEVAVPKMPVMTKAEVLGFARSGRMKFLHYTTSDIRVRVYRDAAVVSGRLQRTRVLNGRKFPMTGDLQKCTCASPKSGEL